MRQSTQNCMLNLEHERNGADERLCSIIFFAPRDRSRQVKVNCLMSRSIIVQNLIGVFNTRPTL